MVMINGNQPLTYERRRPPAGYLYKSIKRSAIASNQRKSKTYIKHQLKTLPEYFQPLWTGKKRFEVRKDDRGYCVGDILILDEWSELKGYTGRQITAHVMYLMKVDDQNQSPWVIMSLDMLTKSNSRLIGNC